MPRPIDFHEKLPAILGHHDNDIEPYNKIRSSSLGYCPRGMLTSKLGLKTFPGHVEAAMFIGTGIHRALQDHEFYDDVEMVAFEEEVSETFRNDFGDETVISGHYDARDENGVLYDWKTTASLDYVQDAPQDHHLDQLQAYLNLEDADQGELVYIQRWINKDDDAEPLPVVQHTVERDEDRFYTELVPKAHGVRELAEEYAPLLQDSGIIPETVLPEPCDSYFCQVEELDDRVIG